MTATCIHLTDTEATVVLKPCWLARLFGARTKHAQIRRDCVHTVYGSWKMLATGNALHDSNHTHALILDAITYRPVAQLPEARVL
jgi:hypothetical protein